MRVIAGTAGGIPLDVPKAGVRPTMDRVKAAIFSSLGDLIVGARVLDLFAGTGGLGIEALSRGAASAVFVEDDRAAVKALERNLARGKFAAEVRNRDVFDFLRQRSDGENYTVVFADPPYEKTKTGEPFTALLLSDPNLARRLDPAGLFVLEKMPSEKLPEHALWEIVRAKKYGATEVIFFRRAAVE